MTTREDQIPLLMNWAINSICVSHKRPDVQHKPYKKQQRIPVSIRGRIIWVAALWREEVRLPLTAGCSCSLSSQSSHRLSVWIFPVLRPLYHAVVKYTEIDGPIACLGVRSNLTWPNWGPPRYLKELCWLGWSWLFLDRHGWLLNACQADCSNLGYSASSVPSSQYEIRCSALDVVLRMYFLANAVMAGYEFFGCYTERGLCCAVSA